jgi:hypothetical protein
MAAAAIAACLAAPAAAQDAAKDPNPGAMTISGAVDFSNAYMFRGIRQERNGLVTWPYFDLGIALFSTDEGSLRSVGVNFGTWNSLHTGITGADGPTGKLWYESDFYATLGLGFGGGFTLGTTYTAYTSPNNGFSTVKEIAFKGAVDDSAYLKKAAVKPYALIAFEMDTSPGQGQADGGSKRGTYVEIGAGPGYTTSKASITVPVKVGLSASNYYENPLTGEDSKFGYFSVAGVVTVPLGGTTRFGAWNVHGGVEYQRLGDTLKIFNRDADGTVKPNQAIGSVGIGFSY